jgi:hypothetical protein
MMKSFSMALVALAMSAGTLFAHSAAAGTIIPFTGTGTVELGLPCPPPPALPLDCPLTATGTYVDTTGTYGPWTYTFHFMVLSANQPSPTQFLNAGTFTFDDPSAANNDFFGSSTGVFDVSTFTATLNYVVNGGTGAFAGASGVGVGFSQIDAFDPRFAYVEIGQFVIPAPGTLALLALGLMPLVVSGWRKRA